MARRTKAAARPPLTEADIAAHIAAQAAIIMAGLAARVAAGDPINFADIPSSETPKRALEVAAAGRHPCQLVPQGEDRDGAATIGAALIQAYRTAFPDAPEPVLLTDPAQRRIDAVACEVRAPSACDVVLPCRAETSAMISGRVAAARRGPVPEKPDRNAMDLMADAAAWIPLSPDEVAALWRVAESVATLDGARSVRRIDVAEALAYAPAFVARR